MNDRQELGGLPARPDIAQVQRFWEANPLFAFESPFPTGSREFFDWHDQVRRREVEAFAMHLYEFDKHAGEDVLDIGCGIGWLCWHFARNGAKVTGIDITQRAIELTERRLRQNGLKCTLLQANAEDLPFLSSSFDFITCSGVLHHTPNTVQGIREIHRVLRPGGRAMISLYYKNWLFSNALWPFTRVMIRSLFGNVPGRDSFKKVENVEDFVRIYDGNDNPLGKAYGRDEFEALCSDFIIEGLESHYFPRRFLPVHHIQPVWLYRLFDNHCGLMIYASLKKQA